MVVVCALAACPPTDQTNTSAGAANTTILIASIDSSRTETHRAALPLVPGNATRCAVGERSFSAASFFPHHHNLERPRLHLRPLSIRRRLHLRRRQENLVSHPIQPHRPRTVGRLQRLHHVELPRLLSNHRQRS